MTATSARPVKPGDLGVDYSGARPSPHGTRKAGGRFIIRYSAGAGNAQSATAWKLCDHGEIAAAVAAGMDFIANSEWYTTRITEGRAAGHDDGQADLEFWKHQGLHRDASIFVSWDAAPVRSHWAAAQAYLEAYDHALGGHFHVDCYAGTPFLRRMLNRKVIRDGWRTNAGSWSNDGLPYQPRTAHTDGLAAVGRSKTPAAIWQTGNYWWAKQADENLILRPVTGSHLAAAARHAKPPSKPTAAKPARPAPHKPVPGGVFSPDGHYELVPLDDGRVAVLHNGTTVRYL